MKNTGLEFELEVYNYINEQINTGEFFITALNQKVFLKKGYYSVDRKKDIIVDISIEIYIVDPDKNDNIKPSIILVVECKDYKGSLPVDDVEEFHAKLQQIGADNTKGIIVTRYNNYQESALNYARSKGITLFSLLNEEMHLVCECPKPLYLKVNNIKLCFSLIVFLISLLWIILYFKIM